MGKREDGGQVFPSPGERFVDKVSGGFLDPMAGYGWAVDPDPGMSLRDHFAGKAMEALVAHFGRGGTETVSDKYAEISRESYALAAEMLKARESQP